MKIWIRAALSLAVAIATLLAYRTQPAQDLELAVSDLWFSLRGPRKPLDNVVVIAMDEASLRELGIAYGQTWSRKLHADLVNRLADLGAARVVFDILFIGPGVPAEDDAALAAAFKRIPTILGVEQSVTQIAGAGGGYSIENWAVPHKPFQQAAAGLGIVALQNDGGVTRFFSRRAKNLDITYPTLPEAALGIASDPAWEGPGTRDLINYYGPARTVQTISYWEVLQKDLPFPDTLVRGKTVFVGLLLRSDTGAAQKDSYKSPFGGQNIFGVEIHATQMLNLAARDWIRRPSEVLDMLGAASLAGAFTFVTLSVTPVMSAMVAVTILLFWMIGGYILFSQNVLLPWFSVGCIELPLLYVASTLYSYVVARRSEATIRSAFELYVSPEMVPKLGSDSNALKLGGEKLWVTALFTDIQGFTQIAEDLPAEQTSEMLNAYFSEVMDVIFQNQGTLLKFIGDAVFAIWGAPVRFPNHAELAIKTAVAIQNEVEKFNATGRFPPLLTRVGIHTGPMLVGNLGCKRRIDYTAIGDSVNLASRVEGLNKAFGTRILLTEATRRDAGAAVKPIEVGLVRVVGKRELVRLYTVFDPPPESSVISQWQSALDLFQRRSFAESAPLFQQAASAEPRLSGAADLYLKAVNAFVAAPPLSGWSGEIEFERK